MEPVTETEVDVRETAEPPALTLVEVVPDTAMLPPDIEIDFVPETVTAGELTESFELALTVVSGEVNDVEWAETESVDGLEISTLEVEEIVKVGAVIVISWGLLCSRIETALEGSAGE